MLSKEELKKIFSKDWEKHYKIDFLVKAGFKRKQCSRCKEFFWTLDESRNVCADSSCIGYEFIGQPTKRYEYIETWREVENYFKKNGHTSIERYPVVCRWRDDLYFTNASIIDFQPYVVTGEIKPPANPLVVPQACLRFADTSNVGITGGHYTSFIMIGQHAFNSEETGVFYWKDEALEHDFNVVTKVLGAKKEDVVFHEKVWAGGGTFGPCIEFFVNGVELGNCVFMQFKDLGQGKFEELKTKVIDMGAGLERFAWFTNGTPTSYEIVFGPVIKKMKKQAGLKIDEKLFQKYAKLSGLMNVDEQNIKKSREKIAKKLGVSEKELFGMLKPLQAIYAIADHLKALLYASTDGMLPSNSGGGYNIRMILRKAFSANEELDLGLDFAAVLEGHASYLKDLDETLKEGLPTAIDLVEEELKKFKETKEKSRKKIEAVIVKAKKERKPVAREQLITLYESHGVPLELVEDFARKEKVKLSDVQDFYGLIAQKNEVEAEAVKVPLGLEKYPKTRELFYENQNLEEFDAKVLGTVENYVILNETAFYPESGGQAADQGRLNGIKVTDAQKQDGVILHAVEDVTAFKKGQKVFGQVDFVRRNILMRQHTGAHLLNAACRHLLGRHVWQAGSAKDIDKAHLDVTHYKKISDEELRKIEMEANKLIQADMAVTAKFFDRGEAEKRFGFRLYQGGYVPGKTIRVIEVKGLDVEACGGLHVERTGKIGFFKILKRENVRDGVERIVFTTGTPAVQFMHQREELLKQAADNLSVPVVELASSTEKFFREWKKQRKELEKLKQGMVEAYKARLIKEIKRNKTHHVFDELDSKTMALLAQEIVNEKPQATVILASKSDGALLVMAGKKARESAVEVFKKLSAKCQGVGGGKKNLAQGKVQDIQALVKLLK